MTFTAILTREKFELALMMVEGGSTILSASQAVGVSPNYLRDKIRYHQRAAGTYENPYDTYQRPLERQPKDTRGFTARLAGDPLPGRSALDQLRKQVRDKWQLMDISAAATSCRNGYHEDA